MDLPDPHYPQDPQCLHFLLGRHIALAALSLGSDTTGMTVVTCKLSLRKHTGLTVDDACGHRVGKLVMDMRNAGLHLPKWDGTGRRGRSAGTGVYFCRLKADGAALTRKMVLTR